MSVDNPSTKIFDFVVVRTSRIKETLSLSMYALMITTGGYADK